MQRLNHNHKHTGDAGYSNILDGHIIRKDDPACNIYSYLEHLNNRISICLTTHTIKCLDLYNILDWLKNYSFNISAFAFSRGSTNKYALTDNFLIYFQNTIEYLNNIRDKNGVLIKSAPDFISHSDLKHILLDEIRILIRDVERAYTSWRYHPLILEYLAYEVEVINLDLIRKDIQRYGLFLNRLSTYLWIANRYECFLSKNDLSQESYWNIDVA